MPEAATFTLSLQWLYTFKLLYGVGQ